MEDIVERVAAWVESGKRVALATVVEVERKAPRDPGAALAVNDEGEVVGSISGGCVEPALIEIAREVLAGGPARVAKFGISDDDAFAVGLSCGGTIHVLVERVS